MFEVMRVIEKSARLYYYLPVAKTDSHGHTIPAAPGINRSLRSPRLDHLPVTFV